MYKLRFVLLSMMLAVSSCSTVDAIFGPDEPQVGARESQVETVSNKDQLTQENAQLGTEITSLRDELKQIKQDIADKKAQAAAAQQQQEAARIAAAKAASMKARKAMPTDRLWVTVSFRSGYMELPGESRQALKRLAKKFLSKSRMQTIDVRGYTDNEPIGGYPGHRHQPRHPYKTNMALSQARAVNVANALIAAGIPKEIVKASGFGASQYVADNTTEAGRQRNRRAEIHLVTH